MYYDSSSPRATTITTSNTPHPIRHNRSHGYTTGLSSESATCRAPERAELSAAEAAKQRFGQPRRVRAAGHQIHSDPACSPPTRAVASPTIAEFKPPRGLQLMGVVAVSRMGRHRVAREGQRCGVCEQPPPTATPGSCGWSSESTATRALSTDRRGGSVLPRIAEFETAASLAKASAVESVSSRLQRPRRVRAAGHQNPQRRARSPPTVVVDPTLLLESKNSKPRCHSRRPALWSL